MLRETMKALFTNGNKLLKKNKLLIAVLTVLICGMAECWHLKSKIENLENEFEDQEMWRTLDIEELTEAKYRLE